jgi:DnaJ-class molecular chaperone
MPKRKQRNPYGKEPSFIRCPRCGGTGCETGAAVRSVNEPYGSRPATCRQCEGTGKVPGVEVSKPGDTGERP